ncbi:hypothetical protein EHF33_16985 (plasmid) [Deinococcus psychrotolerans]|uniref:Uncharacterized protein n=1 Tax=Deinococcus psychrotolerans TaxID=2489213 RepID=A0A3G8YH30_9DEIO|nr:hypothetical protein [Deinococcus psychrotolerans]AZI44598.1 hypothetical protein EHF33_16985 [Deinococcus psychrotolerans]
MNSTPPLAAELIAVAAALAAEDPWRALTLLSDLSANPLHRRCGAYWRWLSLAHGAAGQVLEAEIPLRRASALGDLEAEVEYGRWLSRCGQVRPAAGRLAAVIGRLPSGELKRRAQVFWSEALFLSGEVERALILCRSLSPVLADPATKKSSRRRPSPARAAAAGALAQMHLQLGELEQASARFEQALTALPASPCSARIACLSGWAVTQSRLGQAEEAQRSLEEGRRLSLTLPSGAERWARASLLQAELEVRLLGGERSALQADLRGLGTLADQLQDYELRLWTVAQQSELLSVQGRADQALLCLYDLGTRQGLPPRLKLVRGLLMRRQRYEVQALDDLQAACRETGPQDQRLLWRGQLFAADLQLSLGQAEAARETLRRVLVHLGQTQDFRGYAADLEELGELVEYALIEPQLAPLMQALLARLQTGPALRPKPMRLEVRALGHVSVGVTIDAQGGQAPAPLSAGAALLLIYIYLHPHQSRNDMQAVLFPEFDRSQTTTFFRTTVRELRAVLGQSVVQLDDTLRHPRYQLGGGIELSLDLDAVRQSLNAADLETALQQYQGCFFEGLTPESEWADQVRQEVRLAFNLVFQLRLSRAQTTAELRGLEHNLAQALAADAQIAEASPALAQALESARQRLS